VGARRGLPKTRATGVGANLDSNPMTSEKEKKEERARATRCFAMGDTPNKSRLLVQGEKRFKILRGVGGGGKYA